MHGEGSRGSPDTQAREVNLLECDTHDSVDIIVDQISNIVDHGNGNSCCNRSGESKPGALVDHGNDARNGDQLSSGTGMVTSGAIGTSGTEQVVEATLHGMNGAEATLQFQDLESSREGWIQVNRGSRKRANR